MGIMAFEPLPAELREFLTRHIDSIAQLEALLLLRGAPDTVWSERDAAARLYVGGQEAAEALSHLAALGLLTRTSAGYRYAPRSDELLRAADLLSDYYRRHLIPITNLVHAKPRRIRQFADAFKLKKD
jgi:hypothetical protein